MRLFIAINISDRSRKLINNKINILKEEIKENIKWVDKENWHITIKFLGEVKENKIDNIKNKIKNLSEYEKFYLQFNKINAFPNLNYPKVMYLAINKSQGILKNIHKEIENELLKINFKKEDREFTPHLTIARTKKRSDLN
ncbi:MAG: RNA 2',3'-cyclic phosphodiesterase, partial [Bacillota bacterium]